MSRIFAYSFLLLCLCLSSAPVFSESIPAESNPSKPAKASNNYFAEQFYMRPDQKISFRTTEIDGLVFIQTPNRQRNAQYSLITDFQGPAMKSQYIPGPNNLEELQKWVKENLTVKHYKGVDVKRVTLPSSKGGQKPVYVVGHKGFASVDDVKLQIEQTKDVIQAQGGDFKAMVQEADKFYFPPQTPPETPATKAQFEKEEALALRYLDYMDIGNELFGPIQGVPSGERITWQSFGETSWRLTNFEQPNSQAPRAFRNQVGFWTNRVVFKGIKAPFNTVDPFVETTIAMDTTGVDFKSNAIFAAGLEWRPFARSHMLSNFAPWGLPLLNFVKSYRAYILYADRKNIKDEITGSKSHDWRAGVSIFYEWGVDLPPITEAGPSTLPDYIRRYVWGEYFGNYYFTHTNFYLDNIPPADDFIFNSSVILGFKLPGIPLPPNPINDEFVLMPYFRFEHVNSARYSFFYENRYYVAVGARWMPFNTYRYKDNEWLAKTKVFVEYGGVGKAHYWKQHGVEPDAPDYDFRVGVNISSKRT